MSTITLHQQIVEVENELAMRADVYGRRIIAGKMRQSEADYRMSRMRAVLTTLQIIKRYEPEIRAAIAAARLGAAEAPELSLDTGG